MATEVRHRRGTTAQHASFTGAQGEITVDTDKKVTVVHDGVTPGGFPSTTAAVVAGKANSGANSDITSLSGLTTPLSIAQGGTGGNTQATARTALGSTTVGDAVFIATNAAAARTATGAAVSGVNNDITSLTALTAGGLPDNSVLTADIANAQITAAKLDGAQSGSAPIFGIRAWVNFNGTGTPAIRASGNVTSITDNGAGDYTVNFTTAMADANYAVSVIATDNNAGALNSSAMLAVTAQTAAGFRFVVRNGAGTNYDPAFVCAMVVR